MEMLEELLSVESFADDREAELFSLGRPQLRLLRPLLAAFWTPPWLDLYPSSETSELLSQMTSACPRGPLLLLPLLRKE